MKVIIETNKIKHVYTDVTDIHFCKECDLLEIIQKVYSKNSEVTDYTSKQRLFTSMPYSVIKNIKIILHEDFKSIIDKYGKEKKNERNKDL